MRGTPTPLAAGVLLCAAVCIAAQDTKTPAGVRPQAGAEWKLPATQSDLIGEPTGSADGRLICFAVMSFPRESPPAAGGPQVKFWMLETTSGKLTDLGELLSKKVKRPGLRWAKGVPSPDGRHILALAMVTARAPKMAPYVLTLQSGAVHKVAEAGPMFAVWSKDKLYVSMAGEDGKLGPIRVHDPTTARSTQLKVCGLVAAVEPTGKFLVCACDPDSPAKALGLEAMPKAQTCMVSPEGKVLAKLASSEEMSRPPVISPGGKYLALGRQKWHGHERPPELLGTRIISADGKTQRDVKAATPLAVTDKGELVVLVQVPPGGPDVAKFIDPAGKAVTLATSVRSAIVCGDLLFYVPADTAPKLKAVALKKP